nr:hypothetical protein [Tanacetum cinerariifolium]
MAAVKHSIRESTPYIINDHGYGLSFILAFVDMVSTVLHMSGMTGLHLSHQVLMDAHCDDVPSCVALATKKELGIQTIDTYPYIMGERPTEEWSESEYIAGESKWYRIDDVKYILLGQNPIIQINPKPAGKPNRGQTGQTGQSPTQLSKTVK